ncbi:LmbU family transcriptional regulator [Streptomyces sp. XD-27]|uniref:LmbU family transcriptional regulator n=1 Tax=Streptomyces sp. XD-27 TaxID=3062779 RepID=UPI0026F42A77|nr:LmbU family transcriptional regulator [Streptomyces sp. XD-27]WKX71559.1 LmbU family transcriptional regulator [Streptomyces sp. XD-27]
MSRYKAGPVGGELAQRDVVLSFLGEQAQVQKTGMTFSRSLSERSWERIGSSLRELTNSSAWWLGDWLIFGEATYGWRRYREAIERTGLDYQTLRNYAWVARRFEHHRRRDGLSFAHHAEVTRLSPPEQDYWLRKAEQQKWSRNELRKAVRASLAEQSDTTDPPASSGDEQQEAPKAAEPTGPDMPRQPVATLTIELPAGQLDSYARVAAAHGLPIDKWVTQVLDAADRRAQVLDAADRRAA